MKKAVLKEGPRAPLFFAVATLLLLSARISVAQSVELSSLENCASLETPELKLACFEAIIAAARTPAAQVPEAAAVVGPENVPMAIDHEPDAANIQVTPGATAAAAMASEPPADDFGEEQLVVPERKEEKIIRATVTKVSQGYNKTLYFHLANGHVWRQIEPRRLQYPKSGNFEVSISQGVMGAYRLRIGDNGRLVSIRRVH